MATMSPVAIKRLQNRVRRVMTDGLALLAVDIVGRLCDQRSTMGVTYRDQPNASRLAYVMRLMPDMERIEYNQGKSLWKLIIDEEE